jgi:hypothetical protein
MNIDENRAYCIIEKVSCKPWQKPKAATPYEHQGLVITCFINFLEKKVTIGPSVASSLGPGRWGSRYKLVVWIKCVALCLCWKVPPPKKRLNYMHVYIYIIMHICIYVHYIYIFLYPLVYRYYRNMWFLSSLAYSRVATY